MAYRIEKNGDSRDVIIDGFEKGIADSPELGMGDMRSVNITSVPGEASVSFSTQAANIPPIGQTGVVFTAVASTDTITVASTTNYYNGMAIKIASTSVPPQINVLLVAGGGAGAGTTNLSNTGGGGGGQVLSETSVAVSVQAYSVAIGAGGTGNGGNGGNTTAFGFTATGGTGGLALAGGASGSGNTGGAGNAGGGNGAGGGGGGDSQIGAAGTQPSGNAQGGAGGNGTTSSLSGASVTYGGGAGGGAYGGAGNQGAGGTGGGGTGGGHSGGGAVVAPTAGTVGTGGGGGGAGGNTTPVASAIGGSGTLIISYPIGAITATWPGGTQTTSGGNTIWTANSSGAGTFTITAINPQVGNIYYIGNLSSTQFKLYYDVNLTHLVDIIADFSGTYDVPSFGTPLWSSYNPNTFILDTSGNIWYLNTGGFVGVAVNALQYAGNTGHSATNGLNAGICQWHNYLFAFFGTHIDYLNITAGSGIFGSGLVNAAWVYSWQPNGSLPLTNTIYQHYAISATDDIMYICNAGAVASLNDISGTFDPTNSATYTYTPAACSLPFNDNAQYLCQLGAQNQLFIGGILSYVYVWNRLLLVPDTALICADANIVRMVSTNSNVYVFAGSRGRIYITNGAQLQLYKKIPDSLTGNPEPYYNWQDALYYRNKLYFTLTATDNSSNTLSTMGGIWAVGIDAGQSVIQLPTAGSLFGANQLSYGTYGGSCPVLFYNQSNTPLGYGICGAWVNSTTTGVDVSAATPYTNYQTYIQTDIIPIGTFYKPTTNSQVEYKLSKPLVAGEMIRISTRPDLTSSFTVLWTSSTTGQLSDAVQVNFQKYQWLQFLIEMSSTVSNPTYDRLREIRFR